MKNVNIQEVLKKDLCTLCGACKIVCKYHAIHYNQKSAKLEVIEENCLNCGYCKMVCPGIETETPKLENKLFNRTRTTRERWLGIYQNMYRGYSLDLYNYETSASGGSTTTILKVAKKFLDLDYIMVMGRDSQHHWKAKAKLCKNKEELSNYSQSTYQQTIYLDCLKEILESNQNKRIGIVALPCQVQALRKLQFINTRLGNIAREQIVLIVEIACSSNTTLTGTETLIRDVMKIPLDSVLKINYRDGKYPGYFTVYTKDGKKNNIPFWQAVRHFKDYKSFRCLSCADWMSGLADISLCDGDSNIYKSSQENIKISNKQGIILARTTIGKNVIDYAVQNKMLYAEYLVNIDQSVNLGLQRKRNRRRFYELENRIISSGPIEGYHERIDVISDEEYIPDLIDNDIY